MRIASLSFRLLLFAVLFGLVFMLGACSTNATVGKVSINDRFNTGNVPGFQQRSVTASCNQGEQMVSGGYSITPTAYSQPNPLMPSIIRSTCIRWLPVIPPALRRGP